MRVDKNCHLSVTNKLDCVLQVEEYFSMLPEISVPILGTPGERYRDRQLAIQLPKQDLARAYCRHLNAKHASSADDFMAGRNEIDRSGHWKRTGGGRKRFGKRCNHLQINIYVIA